MFLSWCRKKLENRMGMEKNAAGHRLKINKVRTSASQHLASMLSMRLHDGSCLLKGLCGCEVGWLHACTTAAVYKRNCKDRGRV